MITKDNQERFIDFYLTGRLNLPELDIIEKKIKNDEEFANLVGLKRDILIGIREVEHEKLKIELTSINVNQLKREQTIRIIRPLITTLSLAASVIIIIGLSIILNSIYDKPSMANSKRGHYSSQY